MIVSTIILRAVRSLQNHPVKAGKTGDEQIYPNSPGTRIIPLAKRRDWDSTVGMIRRGFLDSESRKDLTEMARDGSAAHRLARRANALVLLDDGMSCEAIAQVLLLDDDTIRSVSTTLIQPGSSFKLGSRQLGVHFRLGRNCALGSGAFMRSLAD